MAKPHKKHHPQRTCVVCRTTDSKRRLTRLVRSSEGDGIWVDPSGKKNGRGAYLCGNPACWQKAIRTDIVGQALRTQLTDIDRERLRTAAAALEPMDNHL